MLFHHCGLVSILKIRSFPLTQQLWIASLPFEWPLEFLDRYFLGIFQLNLGQIVGWQNLGQELHHFLDFSRTDRVLNGKALQGILLDT
jgi:hypothetical protein